MKQIHISFPDVTLSAELLSTPTADRILEILPVEGTVHRWGEEIYFEIPLSMPLAEDARADVAVGDLGYWPTGQAFCIFFGPTPVSTGPMPRAYSPVNVFGHISGDILPLRSIPDGEAIRVTLAAPARDDILPQAVCFDFKGTLLDHRTGKDLIPGMENLIKALMAKHIALALISRNPVPVIKETLGNRAHWFADYIYSSGGKGKLDSIVQFAAECGVTDLGRIVFVDDKAENLLPVASGSSIRVIGFHGSGKYPQTRMVCRDEGIAFAETAADLKEMLGC